MRRGYTAALWAMEHYLAGTGSDIAGRIRALRREMELELGGVTAAASRTLGPVMLWSARREIRRYPRGKPLEPRTFIDRPARARRRL